MIKHIPVWQYIRDNIPHLLNTECFRGCTTSCLKSKIERQILRVTGYDIIVVHIGTNDLANKNTNILHQYQELVQAIQTRNNIARIVLSLPLPRPVDFQTTWPTEININNNVTFYGTSNGYILWKSYKPFLAKQRGHEPQQIKDIDLARDGLHLSDAGTQKLWQQIKLCLTMTSFE